MKSELVNKINKIKEGENHKNEIIASLWKYKWLHYYCSVVNKIRSSAGMTKTDYTYLNTLAEMIKRPNMAIVEIGPGCGASTALWAKYAEVTKGMVYTIDNYEEKPYRYDVFEENMKNLHLRNYIKLYKMRSENASKLDEFKDFICDLVFIDGSHTYPNVMIDINEWFPKLRSGGIMCGHDCQCIITKEEVNELKKIPKFDLMERSYVRGIVQHIGVICVVSEQFGDKANVTGRIWYVQKK